MYTDFVKSKKDLIRVANLLPYPFIIVETVDNDLSSVFFNAIATEEFGYVADEIKSVADWFLKAFPEDGYRKEMVKLWKTEESDAFSRGENFIKIKAQITSKNQIKRWYEVKAFTIDDLYVLAYVDIDNEMKLQNRLKAINENNDRILSILGHDLRTPIANLTSLSTLAANDDISNDDFKEIIKVIHLDSEKVLEMLDTTFQWAKQNLNSFQLNATKINYKILIENIVAALQTGINEKEIIVSININELDTKDSDAEIITIIIRNILTNAIKFTPKGGTISIRTIDNELVIQDSGVGISNEKIFSLLSKTNFVSTRGTQNEQGIGMGMQLVMSLIEKINGKLLIESIVDQGTVIRLQF